MRVAVVVATARTPIGKAGRGMFNDTAGVDMVAPLLPELLARGGVEAGDVEEIVMGRGYPEGATGGQCRPRLRIARVSRSARPA